MDKKQVKPEFVYVVAMERVLELQQNILLKEALIRQQEKEIEKLTTLLNKALNDSEVE
ncbi:MAG: hypothetical protein UCP83_01505 [Intestinibacter bartlettii]|jgi:hypothetical protein|nr:hypothetical protein [Intestinibacter bartlettii]